MRKRIVEHHTNEPFVNVDHIKIFFQVLFFKIKLQKQ